MTDKQSTRDDIAEAMVGVKSADGIDWPIFGDNEDSRADTLVLADAIIASPVIRRIQAEAWDEGNDRGYTYALGEERGALDDDDRRGNPYREEAMTDIDALIAELRGFAAGTESARATLMRDAAHALEQVRASADEWWKSYDEAATELQRERERNR